MVFFLYIARTISQSFILFEAFKAPKIPTCCSFPTTRNDHIIAERPPGSHKLIRSGATMTDKDDDAHFLSSCLTYRAISILSGLSFDTKYHQLVSCPTTANREGCLAEHVRVAELAKSNAIVKSRARGVLALKPNASILRDRGEHLSDREKSLINGCLTGWNVSKQS